MNYAPRHHPVVDKITGIMPVLGRREVSSWGGGRVVMRGFLRRWIPGHPDNGQYRKLIRSHRPTGECLANQHQPSQPDMGGHGIRAEIWNRRSDFGCCRRPVVQNALVFTEDFVLMQRLAVEVDVDADDGKGTEAWGIPKEGYLQYSWM